MISDKMLWRKPRGLLIFITVIYISVLTFYRRDDVISRGYNFLKEGILTSRVAPAMKGLKTTTFPIRDSNGLNAIHSFIWPSKRWPLLTAARPSLTLASHCSVDKLHHIMQLSQSWDGFMSISVFTPGHDRVVADHMITYLRRCSPRVAEKVSFHYVYPISISSHLDQDDFLRSFDGDSLDCSRPKEVGEAFQKMVKNKNELAARKLYPQNAMRNVARRASGTSHCYTPDIDMVPSEGLSSKIDEFLHRFGHCRECAFILPTYEISKDTTFPPSNKKTLLDLLKRGLAQRYHVKVFSGNQKNSKLEIWEESYSDRSKIEVMYNITTYQEYWEPVVILEASAPQFDERYIGYGFTRNSHIMLLKTMGFEFLVLDEAFLSHDEFQVRKYYPQYRKDQIQENGMKYNVFKRELKTCSHMYGVHLPSKGKRRKY